MSHFHIVVLRRQNQWHAAIFREAGAEVPGVARPVPRAARGSQGSLEDGGRCRAAAPGVARAVAARRRRPGVRGVLGDGRGPPAQHGRSGRGGAAGRAARCGRACGCRGGWCFFPQAHLDAAGRKRAALGRGSIAVSSQRGHRAAAPLRSGRTAPGPELTGAVGEPAGRAGPPLPLGSAVSPPHEAGTRRKGRRGVPGRAAPSGGHPAALLRCPARAGRAPCPQRGPAAGRSSPAPPPGLTAVLLLSRTYMDISRERA